VKALALASVALAAGCTSPNCSITGTWSYTRSDKSTIVVNFNSDGTTDVADGANSNHGGWSNTSYGGLQWSCSNVSYRLQFDTTCQALLVSIDANDTCAVQGAVLVRASSTPMKGVSCAGAGSGCQCAVGPVTAANSFKCDTNAFPDSACCADSGWPASGSCACGPLRCMTGGGFVCYCAYNDSRLTLPPQSACVGANHCCNTNGSSGNSCICSNDNITCAADNWIAVASCTSADYPPACWSGKKVTSCSQ
jgi:hypothetical protein